jgi:hypothetical protein
MTRQTWEHLTSDVIIEIIAWRSGLSLTCAAALYEIVIREDGYDLFIDVFQYALDSI